ncbi:MAG: hypothetical protein A2452_12115 [Candidatus Firestonebacteria bacterium RIFOXYC2_FULL_39_67]|nr:MAG: hypothetical protein A2536_00220 [Candidatus Firestonebacteria bacterium RIFOXYD2_FULL_39_29]OGF55712.1 MAG: hypothetical protein A2452_12115 [Candidatus Firestonebacteria bacterium RIFOXYC2_FULL_39_67]OGF57971.1 MAG: hypothetical protein A2497_02420 [Candidatus Firestonebacteria bacterium RifOxyC12_full_39_7]
MPKKVMIVDDDTSFLEELVEMIKMSGYDVISSDNSADVVKIVRKEKPDVILMDLKMDGLNGFQLVMMLKHYKDISNIPVIIMTGHYNDEVDVWLENSFGVHRFIKKPFNPLDVISRIEETVAAKI